MKAHIEEPAIEMKCLGVTLWKEETKDSATDGDKSQRP